MDEIRRKLKLLDRQLTGGTELHRQIVRTSPLLFVAVGLMVGIFIQNAISQTQGLDRNIWPFWLWMMLLVFLAAISVITFFKQKSDTKPEIAAYLAAVCFICLGAVRLIDFYKAAPNDICNLVGRERKLATIRGFIITEPYIKRNEQWEFAKFMHSDPTTSFYLKVKEAQTKDSWEKITGTVRVTVAEPLLDIKAGDYIQIYCWLDKFKKATNPGQFDIAKYLARKRVFVAAYVKSPEGIEMIKAGPLSTFAKLQNKLKEVSAEALLGGSNIESKNQGLLQALLLGYRKNIDNKTYTAFRKTGLLHFISLSGMHLGILVGVVWWLCARAGLMKPARAVICIIVVAVFLLIVPPRAPTVRAAIISWVFCLSFFFRRRFNSLNTLSLAAIILLLIRPTQLFEPGWQLSFASVLGILLFCKSVHLFLYEKITGLPWIQKAPLTKPFYRIVSRPGPYLLRLFSTGLTAWMSGTGILLYHFYTINPLTCIWTVIVFPLVAAILTIGYLKIILSLLTPTVAALSGVLLSGLCDLLIWIVKLIAHLGVSEILIGSVPFALVALYYCFIFFTGLSFFRYFRLRRIICTVTAFTIIVWLGGLKWQRTHRNNLVISVLDIGHGQAILVRMPGEANILFDAGSLNKSDPARRIILPFLDHQGIDEIEAIIISHDDIDHINAIPEVFDGRNVRNIYTTNDLIKHNSFGATKHLKRFLNNRGAHLLLLSEAPQIVSPAKIKFLWPTEKASRNEQLSDNDRSLVSIINFAGRKILFCSDIEKYAQRQILQLFGDLTADVVVVPHHGSAKTAEAEFLENLESEVMICSCARGQYEKHQVIEQDNNKRLFYTAKDGAITVTIGESGSMDVRTYATGKAISGTD
ncbi:MAG: DNA internalization-related competence protein ComEC/Rec2 [Sedimentisphaerales bacterium]|nr:DNA internalization-related competence protein ComEC/Rec2 [Sedimentisphaerales bacterium]